ncbi:hypothetical protein SODALDRAFT_320920 [Sodiomyces alkalinus F11]|uniref:Uncharacterized protein n=1 Tax=Sodiomyces alkalinus (strain CBS 110278 / VKM F-3762 / F11) TaxID=1314773 RepID=A0A3N2PM86_SODAK|nr:hypothetical protein SODALDRAFT_320920 [Sodiomyces alkalinus F11]ROT35628.1 hypothetical protein SODALDRAFT_320920 [Sodiomyces alkalinus F11]
MAGDCAPEHCPPGNAVLLALFALLVPVTVVFGHRFKTPLFASALTTGLLLEVLGFVGRVLLFRNVADRSYFALSLVGTVLGPTFIAASLFLVLPHAVSLYGPRASSIRPKHIGLGFAGLILIAGILEIIGAVFAAFAIIGQGNSQAAALILFIFTHLWLAISLSGEREKLDPKHARVYRSSRFKHFLLATGMGGLLSQHEIAFMLVNGLVPLLACIILTAFPPGAAFGTAWGSTSPRFRSKHNLQPLPLPLRSPKSPYDHHYRDRRTSPLQQAGFYNTSEKQQQQQQQQETPTSAGSMPLHESTMATAIRNNPVTQTTTQQPTPVATTQKHSPTYWREQQYHLQYGKPSPTSPHSVSQQSPSQSPTFPTGGQQQQQHSPGLASEYSPFTSSRRTSMKPQATPKQLVDSDSLW